jgi:pectate lyase
MEFFVGQELDWLHGLHSHRIGTVVKVEDDRIMLQGLNTHYWIKKSTMIKKLKLADRRHFLGSRNMFASPQ